MDWLGVLIGFGLGIFATFLIEALRSPRFEFSVEPVTEATDHRGTWRIVSLRVRNRKLPWILHLLDETASLCRAEIQFRELGATLGEPLIGPLLIDPIDGRWPSFQAEPIDYSTGTLDVAAVLIPHRETIRPGESLALNVAIKFDGEARCYGFNNRSYIQDDGPLRYSKQRLDARRMMVRVVIHFEGAPQRSPEFLLYNHVTVDDFELAPMIP